MNFTKLIPAFAAALLALAGCQSYDIVQANVFSDEDGNIVRVDYGRSEKPHVNTFIAPTNGQEMEFKSRLVVKVHLPDGDRFTAWQCMNFMRSGTMYKTDDEEWMFLANGFTCIVYLRDEATGRYRTVYRGVLCESPKTDFKESDKWRKMKQGTRGKEDWQ